MCLAAHPDKQTLVAQELRRLGLLASADNPEPRNVTADDLPKMVYLDTVWPLSLPVGSHPLRALHACQLDDITTI